MRFAYPVEILDEPEGITITCPDVPEMVTGGWGDLPANLDAASDALVAALSFYVSDDLALPVPSPARGRHVVTVPLLVAAKLALYRAKRAARMTNVELGKRLGIDEKDVRRLLDPTHNSRIGQVEAALKALGRRLVVEEREAA